jgi:hypothetical protein
MPIVGFDEQDFLRGKIVAPGWYLMEIGSVGEKPAANGESTNYPTEGTIIKNDDDDSTDFAGVPVMWNFNSKFKSAILAFLAAMGQEVTPGQRVQLEAAVGKKIAVYVDNKTYEGRILNDVKHKYRAPKAA